jgi:hypothetical protein
VEIDDQLMFRGQPEDGLIELDDFFVLVVEEVDLDSRDTGAAAHLEQFPDALLVGWRAAASPAGPETVRKLVG